MQRQESKRTHQAILVYGLVYGLALILSLIVLGCGGGDDSQPNTATANDLANQEFAFQDGAAFGFNNDPVTLRYGAFSGNSGTFDLIAPTVLASGTVTISSCNHLVTASNNEGILPVGTAINCQVCNIQSDNSLSVVCGSANAASSSQPGTGTGGSTGGGDPTGTTGTGGSDTTGSTGG